MSTPESDTGYPNEGATLYSEGDETYLAYDAIIS